MIRYQPFRKKKPYTFIVIIVIVLAVIFSFSAFRDLFGLRGALNSVIFPFQFIVSTAWKGALEIPSSILKLRGLLARNAELENQLNVCRSRLSQFEELVRENDRLSRALDFQQANRYRLKLLAARVIGRGADPGSSIITVDRGGAAGVRVNMPVIVKEGLVGKVVEVWHLGCKIMLVTDPASSVAAVDQRSRVLGIVEGYSPDMMLMKYVNLGKDVAEGDMIVTSSISGVFPPGLPIGTVTHVTEKETGLFLRIEVKPAVNFSTLEEVFLVF